MEKCDDAIRGERLIQYRREYQREKSKTPEYKEKRRERYQRWKAENPEAYAKMLEKNRERQADNPEPLGNVSKRQVAYQKRRRELDPAWYEEHRRKVKEQYEKKKLENPEWYAEILRKKREAHANRKKKGD